MDADLTDRELVQGVLRAMPRLRSDPNLSGSQQAFVKMIDDLIQEEKERCEVVFQRL